MQAQQEIIKLTDWTKEPKVQDLKRDFEQAQSYQAKHITNLNRWEDNFNVKPIAENKENKAQSRINPKLIRKQFEWRCSSLVAPFLSTSELFKINPITHEDVQRARQNQLILNYQFQSKINKIPFIDSLIRTCVREGTVIVRTGWEYEEKVIEKNVPAYNYYPAPPEFAQQLQQYIKLLQTEPDSFETLDGQLKASIKASVQYNQPVIAEQFGFTVIKEVVPVVNKPTLEVCNTRNFYIDPTCEGDVEKAKFAVYSFESCLADLKADGRYKNLDIVAQSITTNDSPFHTYSDASSFTFEDKARKKLTVYEYWGYYDIKGDNSLTPIVASWVGNTLIRLEENPYPDKRIPFVVIPYIPEQGSIYGIPDGELLEDNQKILGAVTRGVIDLLGKSANSQTGVPKGLLDATNLIKFKKGLDYEYNPTNNPNAIYMHKFPEIPQSAMWLINQTNNDAEALSGVKAFSGQGITGAGLGDTAAGVRSAMDAASKRESNILWRISHGLIQVARKILAMNAVWLSEKEVVRLTNGAFVPVRADDLAGEYDLSLSISTAEADEAKAKELAFMLQTMGNTMGMDLAKIILADIARLRKMPELANRIETYQPEPDPVQQQLQQLEMQRLQAEIALLQAQAKEAFAKGNVQQAKVGVEQARADSLQGDADLKSLDFVQNQTGEKHLRDLESKNLDNQNELNKQTIKGNQDLDKQLIQFGLNEKSKSTQHNSDLLKMYADSVLNKSNPPRQLN